MKPQQQLGAVLAWACLALCLTVDLVLQLSTRAGAPGQLWMLTVGVGFAAAGITHPGANVAGVVDELRALLAQLHPQTPAGGAVPQPDTAPPPAPAPPAVVAPAPPPPAVSDVITPPAVS